MIYDQSSFDIRFEWGLKGVQTLAPISDVIIIVDVLSFSTSVDIATSQGALIYPYKWKDESALAYAESKQCELADIKRENKHGYTLSPASFQNITRGTKLVLPSPNGSTLSLSTGTTLTLCGCLRNANAVANYANSKGKSVAVIAAGERWEDNTLRPAFEDLLGAGAIISELKGLLSPESKAASAVFRSFQETVKEELLACISGKELIERGFEEDVHLAAAYNTSQAVPILIVEHYAS